ncbi:metal ABC transporter substrate-binding protein [Thermoflexus sp.]|uniref:metal ABC transporter substrate-binding protein n=1 Tax=Thermoflexus sp. TaxID=1969742 RepID=UPI0035E46420
MKIERHRWGGILLSVLLLAACASPRPAAPVRRLRVVTTVAPLTNLVYNVGGDRIDLHGLIPEGVDSHTFEPAPEDAQYLAQADLIVLNGLNLETSIERLALANKKPEAVLLKLGDMLLSREEWIFDFSFPPEKGDPNPHVWMDPIYARGYVERIRDALVRMDPANRTYYEQNAAVLLAELDRLDRAIREAIMTIPPSNRKLLTYHDSWAYFARRYGMTVIGAIQPSDFREPSAREVAALIEQIRREKVPAIFGSEVFPSKVLEQIGRETGARYIDTLRDDTLPGEPGSPEHSYLHMMVENVRTIVTALGGRADALQEVDIRNIPDRSRP